MGPGDLKEILSELPPLKDPRVLVGNHTSDDAGVVRLTEDIALVQTVDFITPVVDDPFDFGAIAAANALSDIYAMGGKPLCALNLLANSGRPITNHTLSRILLGGRDTADRAGVLVVGGHSVKSPELMYGLSVTGTVHPARIITNHGARPGDKIILTKPIGVGIITTALKNEAVDVDTLAKAVAVMKTLNQAASEAMVEVGVNACTDVTGFGLLGHLWEMVQSSGISVQLQAHRIPHFEEAIGLAKAGNTAGGLNANRQYLEPFVQISSAVAQDFLPLLFDPQTSGGLLISVSPENAERLLQQLHKREVQEAGVIGEVIEDKPSRIVIEA